MGALASLMIVVVCTGNTCRSPMAEALFRKAVAGRDDITVSSAGVAAAKGTSANRETLSVLKKRGVSLENFKSRPVSESIMDEATHVFAMTQGQGLGNYEYKFAFNAYLAELAEKDKRTSA